MFGNPLIGHEQFPRVVVVGKLLFVWNKVVNATVAFLTNHNPSAAHLIFAEPFYISLSAMNRSWNEMMLCEGLFSLTQFAFCCSHAVIIAIWGQYLQWFPPYGQPP